ncbi:MAG: hypothetical protein GW939_04240 [Candidatus Magasanikbacteria bacterium]|uniref:Outer membrane protein beta-barrel domain-containing protein n=1 Tax=Candidatus Magasanikbacteria bacterium CG10_big_fil_rev_8_21_14_0_10_38_6 TaxID=1974647 RepID=A0A2M6P2C0_9BACT|nr:hypothetical protein [Candidatus Magasanikbacteria bacterium]NCS72042.1 hypothetical protein [Candidatus Magasanikbacteria bacterium]PIR77834.1 MAG: hypothetical protein COU30_00315 [Candidatus Magasanikbacteria bacterium CG10_big_fil_rev_8_21_14_0_10_38_6]
MNRIFSFLIAAFILITAFVLNINNAEAQTGGFFITSEVQTADTVPIISGGMMHTFEGSPPLGASFFALTTQVFSEIYAGPTWAPKPWLSLSLSMGVQSLSGELAERYGASVWLGNEYISSLTVMEGDNSGEPGLWYDHTTSMPVVGGLALGIHGRRFVGSGLMVTYAIGSTGLTLSANWMPWDPEAATIFTPRGGLIGVSWSPPN